jgi:hypothetical protein
MIDDRRPTALAIPGHGNLRMAYARPVAKPKPRNPHLRLVQSARVPAMPRQDPNRLRRGELRLVSARRPPAATTSYAALVLNTVRRWLGARPS